SAGGALRERVLNIVNGNLRRSICFRAMHKFAEREFALFAVASAEGIAKVGFLVFLEKLHGFTSAVGLALALVGASETELSGGVIGGEGESFFECGDGILILLQLRLEKADEVIGVGLVGRDLCDVLESLNSLLRFVKIFIGETEVVPGVRIVGKFGAGLFESSAALLQFLLTEERDAKIHSGDGEFRIESKSLLKILLRFRTFLLVEESDAKSVEPQNFGRSGWARGRRSLRGIRKQLSQATETGEEED